MFRKVSRAAPPLAAIISAALLAACSGGAVEVPPPTPDAATGVLCGRLQERLPQTLAGAARGRTEPASEYTMVWGDPAIALRCGVPRPEGLMPTSELTVVNDISWLPLPPDKPTSYTAVGREAYVEVTLPGDYRAPDVLVTLSDTISAVIPSKPAGVL
ncbi:MAG: DUF3515 family protein [Streptosporangiales bacterium]|nr:DUF3515 family protein [Streptosporangiales bacterium]